MTDDIDLLATEGRDLTADPVATGEKTYGRKDETTALARSLAQGRSVVLLGPAGVGKTAVVRKLLSYMREQRIPELDGSRVFEISTVGLCADTRYTGQQETRIRALLAHANKKRLVYVTDLWNLPYAGSYSTNPRGIYELMRPGIEAGKLVLFGETTPGRWEKLCREHASLSRDFHAVAVHETSDEETRDLLMRVAAGLAPAFDKAAIDRVYSLAKKFLPTQSFPGKGVDLLRRVAQAAKPVFGTPRLEPVDVPFVETVFGEQTGLPMHMLSPHARTTYDEMQQFLADRVLGQPEAVSAVADILALYKTGLNDPDQPAGVLLFVGPTGVGKTELAKATSEFLFGTREKIFRVDMSEYKDFHSFEKLIGDPKSGKTGILTDHVRRHPFSVVLLDEFEKGHANLADLFLQVFDDGRLTDASGETVDFRHTLLILTSNVGSNVRQQSSGIGFGSKGADSEEISRDVRRALEATYRPEFLNRIDRILVFHALQRGDMRRIAQRELGKVYTREGLLERDLLLEVDEGVIDLLLDRGFDPQYGARPLKRAIEELLVLPLARAVLSAEASRFQLLRVGRKGDGIALSFEETETSRKLANLERRTRVEDGQGGVVRMSLAAVQSAMKGLHARLHKLEAIADLEKLRKELEELEGKAKSPAFWDEAFGAGGEVYRRHRLRMEIRRVEDLHERAEMVRKMVEASFEEGEDAIAPKLVGEFVRLERQLLRAEREVVKMNETDLGDAIVSVRGVGGKAGASAWAKELASMYEAWAGDRKYEVSINEESSSWKVTVKGPYAFGYLKNEQGGHRMIAAPKGKNDRRGETFLARVEVRPISQADAPAKSEKKPRDDEPPIRTYDQWQSRGVRDRRTGHAEGDVKRVLQGRIDAFLEASVDAT